MKKFSLIIAVALVVAMIATIGASAMWTGELASEQREFSVPKVNANNPAIVIDGKVDLNGEWYGALKTGIDLNNEEDADYYGVWDAGVWGNTMDYPIETYDDIDDKYRMTWDTYWLWDEAGLYFAVVCETDTSYTTYDPDWGFSRVDGFTPMIDATADDGEHNYNWLDFWAATTTGENYWCDDNLTYSSRSENCPYVIETASYRSITPNAEGKYPWYIEGFLSWDSIGYDCSGNQYATVKGEAGLEIEIGLIFLEGAGEYVPDESGTGWTDRPNYIRGFDCPGWNNFNFYIMNANPAEDAPAAEAPAEEPAEEPAVEEPAEEPAEEEPAVEPVIVTPAPAPSTPATADVSVLFYALAAVSAIGGISVFKRK